MKKIKLSALTLVTAALAALYGAARPGRRCTDNDLRFGSYSVFYHTSADDSPGPTCRPGVNFKAENLETLYLRLHPHGSATSTSSWPWAIRRSRR